MSAVVLQRGLIVTVAATGVYSGKPRPAVVVQANRWLQGHPSVTLCPLTNTLLDAPLVRLPVTPSKERIEEGVPADGRQTVHRAHHKHWWGCGRPGPRPLGDLDLALRAWLDLA